MKIFIVCSSYSDYDEHNDHHLVAYVNEEAAKKHVAEIEAEIKRVKATDPCPLLYVKGRLTTMPGADGIWKSSRFETDYFSHFKDQPLPEKRYFATEFIGKTGWHVETRKKEKGAYMNNLVSVDFVEVDTTRLTQLLAPEMRVARDLFDYSFYVDEIELV